MASHEYFPDIAWNIYGRVPARKITPHKNNLNTIKENPEKPSMTSAFIKSTTFHGVDYLYYAANRSERVFWAFICFAMVAVIGYEVYAVINDFMVHPYTSSIAQRQKEHLEVPDIVFCTKHRITSDFIKAHDLPTVLVEYMQSVFSERALFELPVNGSEQLDSWEAKYAAFKAATGYADMQAISEASWIKCEDVFKMCLFSGRSLLGGCCAHVRRFMMSEGPCFAVDFVNVSSNSQGSGAGGMALQHHGGPAHGMTIVMDLQPQKLPATLFNTDVGFGISFHVGHPHLDHDPLPFDNHKLTIPPGSDSYIKLHKRVITRKTKCVNEEYGPKLQYFAGYDTQACLYECMLNSTEKACGCIPLGHNISQYFTPGQHYCEPYESTSCFRPLMYDVNTEHFGSSVKSLKFHEELRVCDTKCELMCKTSDYKAEVVYAGLPNPAVLPLFKAYKDVSDNGEFEVEKRYVVANVYFADIEITEVTEVSTATINGLVSNIGGQLSLFSGCSAVTLIHAIMFVFAYCRRKRQQRRLEEEE